MKIDLFNFFRYFDPKNPNHVAAVKDLESNIDNYLPKLLTDEATWVKTYRTKVQINNSVLLKVPFFPQTDNYVDAQRTCNSSACAMCLEYFKPGTLKGPKGDDEYLRKVFAIGDTTDHAVQTRVLNSYGVKSEFRYNLSFDDLERELRAARPVILGILHRGPLSRPTGGHMIVAIGLTEKGDIIVNDPFGDLMSGYVTPVSDGKGAIYPRSVLEKRWTVDGNRSGWGRIFM